MQSSAGIITEPTSSSERIAVVDVLRAFALFGIIVNHASKSFLVGPSPDPQFLIFSSFDKLIDQLAVLLTFGKFFAIFSFLFGLSFAIQLESATRRASSFSGRFAWRLLILLAIGYVHGLFFSGDILLIYAVLGFLLIPLRNVSTRTLAIVGVILILNIPGLVLGSLQMSGPPPTAQQQQTLADSRQAFAERAQRQYEIKRSGSIGELTEMNAAQSLQTKFLFQVVTGRLWITFGLFLLGMCAGRMNLFRDTAANRTTFTRLLAGAGTIALVTTAIAIAFPNKIRPTTLADVLAGFNFSIHQATLAAFYVAAVTLLFWKRPRGLLAPLAPMGKMGLTTYLTQSAFGLVVFYGVGFGLLGRLGAAACVAVAILFFAAQILFARWWMSRFNLGPVEWLWRSLTYFKLQPNVRERVSAASAG